MNKKLLVTICLTLLLLISLSFVAQAYQIPDEYKPSNIGYGEDYFEDTPTSFATITILQITAAALLYFAAPIAVIMIAIAAFQMTTGGADSEKLEQSKKHLTWTVLGLLVIILSYTIVKLTIGFVTKAVEVAPS